MPCGARPAPLPWCLDEIAPGLWSAADCLRGARGCVKVWNRGNHSMKRGKVRCVLLGTIAWVWVGNGEIQLLKKGGANWSWAGAVLILPQPAKVPRTQNRAIFGNPIPAPNPSNYAPEKVPNHQCWSSKPEGSFLATHYGRHFACSLALGAISGFKASHGINRACWLAYGLTEFLIGSVAEECTQHSKFPVVVVRNWGNV
eukprot:1146145-Pelagomonas_calceolata.AAC.6